MTTQDIDTYVESEGGVVRIKVCLTSGSVVEVVVHVRTRWGRAGHFWKL